MISRRMMSTGAAAALAAALLAQPLRASAQSTNAGDASNPALNAGNTAHDAQFVAPNALAKGASSFTEGEARSRLIKAGLADVTALNKDADGIWRGKATHDGKQVSVGLDFKGAMSVE